MPLRGAPPARRIYTLSIRDRELVAETRAVIGRSLQILRESTQDTYLGKPRYKPGIAGKVETTGDD